ncbi:MAG: aldose epimerase family protein [Anaerorhabdus sp.]|uniref:aldose epimerase family protein n=1 Tax=Anaerorhabdus sp. TaxID=1872524 RepID=UPI002FC9C268
MEIKEFGKTTFGIDAKLYTIENDYIKLATTDYGATLVSLIVKKYNIDVVQGFTNVKGYETEVKYMGQTIGRVCNRIGKGTFELNGKTYHVPVNNNGNSLHGGVNGFDTKMWEATMNENCISFTYTSADNEEGYPGNVKVEVTYELLDDCVNYIVNAESDADTLLNITNHSFFNLDGPKSETVLDHQVKINALNFACVDANGCTHEEILAVKDTPFDFTEFKSIGKDINVEHQQLKNGSGYDHHFLVDNEGFREFARCKGSEIEMIVSSDLPGCHVYSSNFLEGNYSFTKENGKFPYRSSICFETQYYPNAIQTCNQIKPILKKGELWHHKTQFKFI